MNPILGHSNYALYLDESAQPIGGIFIDEDTSMVTNHPLMAVENLTTPMADYALNHAAEKGISSDLVIVQGRRSTVSDEAVNKLTGEGITVITEA